MGVQVLASVSQAEGRRGTFILNKATPRSPVKAGTSRCAMIAQLPWGPTSYEQITDPASFRAKYAPAGFDRTSKGYLTATLFPWADLHVVRVLGANPVKATCQIQDNTPANSILLTGKYFGAGLNGATVVIAAASNGDASSFDMTIEKVNSSTGLKTTEIYQNLDSDWAPSDERWATLFADSLLVGPVTRQAGVRPVNGAYTFGSGSDGDAIASSDYLGTPGDADKGLALLENDPDVAFYFHDVPASVLAAVNAGFKAHKVYMNDRRIAVNCGAAAETKATAKTNVAINRDDGVCYVWGHGKVLDDQGTERTIPLTGPAATFWAYLTPHLSGAVKNTEFTRVLSAIKGLDVSTGNDAIKAELEAAGVVVFEKNGDGVFSPYAAPTSAESGLPLYIKRARDFIGYTLAGALESTQNGPSADETIEDERTSIRVLLEEFKSNKGRDIIARFSINDFEQLEIRDTNTPAEIAAGDCTHGVRVQLIPERKRTFLQQEVDTTVTILVRG